jgi:DNA-binding CsgD family transcriptional regulator
MLKKQIHEGLEQSIRGLVFGDHLCAIFETEEEYRFCITPFIRQGLERGEKVLYIVDAHTSEEILHYLRDDEVETESYLENGQLIILASNEVYLREGSFDPDAMITLLRHETEQALNEGFSALRATGEMTWALKGLAGSGRLVEYEAKLNEFFPTSKCLAICQYDKRRFAPEILLDVLTVHPIVIIGTEVFENFCYMPPEDFFGLEVSEKRLKNWLDNLVEHKRGEEILLKKERRLKQQTQSLEELNTALKVLLQYGDQEKKRQEESILANVQKLIFPYIEELENGMLSDKNRMLVRVIRSHMEDLIAPLAETLSSKYFGLTPTEIQIAALIREGKTSKEIATLQKVSLKTIEFHRSNIRRRLGLLKEKMNLRTYLDSLVQQESTRKP